MGNYEVKVNLSFIKDHPIWSGLGVIATGCSVLWILVYPYIIQELSADFIPRAEAIEFNAAVTQRFDNLEAVVGGIDKRVEVTAAFAMARGIKEDLRLHKESKPSPVTRAWERENEDIEERFSLVEDYKQCLLNDAANCDLMYKQLYQ